MQAHPEACPVCRSRLGDFADDHIALSKLALPAPDPQADADFRAALEARLIAADGLRRTAAYPYEAHSSLALLLPPGKLATLEGWVNHGIGAEAPATLDKFWLALLTGRYERAARWGSKVQAAAMGYIVRELASNVPEGCYGSAEKVRVWGG